MKTYRWYIFLIFLFLPALALAHFMVVMPSQNIVVDRDQSMVTIDLRFAHPFEQGFMDLEMPAQFGVLAEGKKTSLKENLKEVKKDECRTYTTTYEIKRPGDHIFYCEPRPYWEPAEGKFIVHYTKTIVHAFGLEEGWDEMVGFKTEIKPLTRPYGLWTGNVFQGQVLLNGAPVPFAEVEVTYENQGSAVSSPGEVFNIQVVKADGDGVFTYAMPHAGWWGFAALNEDEKKLPGPDGVMYPIEIGALIWVHAVDMK